GVHYIAHILKHRQKPQTMKHQAIAYFGDTTLSFHYTVSDMRSLGKQTREETVRLEGNTILE
ncbi:hypothetical protein PISMIDRAFT_110193, partial [Pisolithus microcarpus 441]